MKTLKLEFRRLSVLSLSLSLCLCSMTLQSPSASAARRHIYRGRVSAGVASADRLLVKGKYAQAANYYQSLLKRHPNDVNAEVGYGMALSEQFKLDAAEQQFDKVLASDPSNPGAHTGKAMDLMHRLQSSDNSIRKNRDSILSQAESEAQKALSTDSAMPEARYTLGMVYKEQGKLAEALDQFKLASQADPNFAGGYTGQGLIKLAQGDPGGAMSNFQQAARLNSGDYTAHYGMGEALLAQGKVDAAIKELNTSLYQFRNSWPVHLALGRAYETQGNTVAALREFQESVRIKPENSAPYLGVANIRESRGDIELSIAELRSALELMPNNADIRQRIGDDSLRVGKLDDAIKEYTTVLSANPGNARAADSLTTAYYLKAQKETTGGFFGDNDYASAEAMIDRAVQMNPNDMRLRLAQAKLRALSGDTVDLSTIGQPQNDGERISYAQALLAQNRFKEAADQLNMVLGHSTTSRQTFAIADLALMIKDLDCAEAAYRKAATMPGGAQRAGRGLTQVQKARETARKDLTLASDLARKHMTGSAIDTYHQAIFDNPLVPDARLGLAKALEDVSHPTAVQLREAATQLRAYVALAPNLTVKEQEKYTKKAEKLDSKATKIAQRTT